MEDSAKGTADKFKDVTSGTVTIISEYCPKCGVFCNR
jgi:hypothetical protein